jgi:hypothetical protein
MPRLAKTIFSSMWMTRCAQPSEKVVVPARRQELRHGAEEGFVPPPPLGTNGLGPLHHISSYNTLWPNDLCATIVAGIVVTHIVLSASTRTLSASLVLTDAATAAMMTPRVGSGAIP